MQQEPLASLPFRGKLIEMASPEPSEPIFARPRVILAGARAIYIGPCLALSPHRNAVATLAIALAMPFEIAWPQTPDRPTETRQIALIPPNTLHHLIAAGPMMFVYLDALADDQRTIGACIGSRPEELARIAADCAGIAIGSTAADIVRGLLALFGLGDPADDISPTGVAAAIRAIDDRPDSFGSAKIAASLAGLSESHFHRGIKRATGVPFRRYRLWRRMGIAAIALKDGASLTDAAMAGGFASSAHFSATFRRMFGIKPSLLINAQARFDVVHSACVATALA
ncbi:MAG: hypothetical protein B7Y43_18230 [Sphingomonas sp. 28-62-20]|uniref:helix-turn-helix transcriptional regulator n=1 Tax=Sphingomonas sp. 28-62-20 TaxID=1970433 RepID=UPI000BC67168|nr:MAG: hypothetical protein B7Y43_18230 [Sphingomonas sp. 28-62-20]